MTEVPLTDVSGEISIFLKFDYMQHNMMYFFGLTAAIISDLRFSPDFKTYRNDRVLYS
jgi:hypothetical protein